MPTSTEYLSGLANVLIRDAMEDAFSVRSHLVYVSPPPERDDEEFEIGFKDLGDEHVTSHLRGFTAPPEWWAMGTITGGWAAPMEDGSVHESARGRSVRRASAHPERVRLTQVFLMARDGTVADRARLADGRAFDDVGAEGLVPDTFSRVFVLPTPPPEVPVNEFVVSVWLDGIARAPSRKLLSWPKVLELNPALAFGARSRRHATPQEVVATMASNYARIDWSAIRRWGTRGSLAHLVEPEMARWMDEGMFSRWVFAHFPPLHELVDTATARLDTDAAGQLRDAVDLLILGRIFDVA